MDPVTRARMAQDRGRVIVGGPARVREKLSALAEIFGVDEVLVVTVCHDPAARLRSYQLLAGAFALESAGVRRPEVNELAGAQALTAPTPSGGGTGDTEGLR